MKATFPSLFKTPLNKFKYFFIYGNDPIVFDRIILCLKRKITSSFEIKSEKDLLANPFLQPSLFGDSQGKPLNLVLNVTDKILNSLGYLTEETYIFTSEKARAQSKLVTHFSTCPHSLAIPAYSSPLLTPEFELLVGDLNLPASFRDLIFKAFQNDYMGLLAALEKIKLYGDVPEPVYASFLETATYTNDFQALIAPFLVKNEKKASACLLALSSADIILFLRSLLRAFQTLYELMPHKGRPGSIPWQKFTSSVFFKDQPLYESALSRWDAEEVQDFLEALLELEYMAKYKCMTLPQIAQKVLKSLLPNPGQSS